MAYANPTSLVVLSVCGALAAATVVVGCGGASGGMRGVGGSGAGGSVGGLGGSGFDAGPGVGGMTTVIPLDCANGVDPAVPPLTDFSSTSWSNTLGKWNTPSRDLTGSKYSAGGPMSTMTNVITATDNPSFNLTGMVAAGDYAFGLLSFDKCVNTHTYTGVQFTVGGDAAGCDLYFLLQTFEQQGVANKGGCPAGGSCYVFPRKKIPVPTTPTPTVVLFSELTDGVPTDPNTMKGEIVGVQWQFQSAPPPDGGIQAACTGINVTIDDVGFSTQ